MTQEIHTVASMRVLSESAFCADGTGTLGDYTYVPFNEGTGTFTVPVAEHDTMAAVQSRVEGREWVLGKKSATLAFAINLAPTGTPAASGVTAAQGALGKLLKATMGGEKLGVGTTFTTGSTAEIVKLTSAVGKEAGDCIAWINADGELEKREIESMSGSDATLKQAFSGAPANLDVCYACATYYFTEDPQESLQFLVEGAETSDRWLLLGGQAVGGVTFAVDPTGDALPTVSLNFTFADHKKAGETVGTITGALADATYTNYEPIVGHVGEFRAFTVGTATLDATSLVHVSACAFNPKIVYVPVPSPSGTNGIYRWRAGRANPPIEGAFDTFFEDLTWWTARDASASKHLQYQMGVTPGYAATLVAPTVQISDPQRVAGGEIAGQSIKYRGRRDTGTGSSTTALAKSPFRVHLA